MDWIPVIFFAEDRSGRTRHLLGVSQLNPVFSEVASAERFQLAPISIWASMLLGRVSLTKMLSLAGKRHRRHMALSGHGVSIDTRFTMSTSLTITKVRI